MLLSLSTWKSLLFYLLQKLYSKSIRDYLQESTFTATTNFPVQSLVHVTTTFHNFRKLTHGLRGRLEVDINIIGPFKVENCRNYLVSFNLFKSDLPFSKCYALNIPQMVINQENVSYPNKKDILQ